MYVTSGVPQGLVLGQILYIMYVYNLATRFPCYLFADDCIVEEYGETAISAINNTNDILPAKSNWYDNNLLKMNSSKQLYLLSLAEKPIQRIYP